MIDFKYKINERYVLSIIIHLFICWFVGGFIGAMSSICGIGMFIMIIIVICMTLISYYLFWFKDYMDKFLDNYIFELQFISKIQKWLYSKIKTLENKYKQLIRSYNEKRF